MAANRRMWKLLQSKHVADMALLEINSMQSFLRRKTFTPDDCENGRVPGIRLLESARAGILEVIKTKSEALALVDALTIAAGQKPCGQYYIHAGFRKAASLYAKHHIK